MFKNTRGSLAVSATGLDSMRVDEPGVVSGSVGAVTFCCCAANLLFSQLLLRLSCCIRKEMEAAQPPADIFRGSWLFLKRNANPKAYLLLD